MSKLVDFVSKAAIKDHAYQFLNNYYTNKQVPIPIDLIAEEKLGIDIVPMPNLMEKYSIDAYLTKDLTTIYVDKSIYINSEVRYRFSIAHEIGHYCMHKYFYSKIKFNTINHWIKTITSIPDTDYDKLELQANFFAGYLLIPDYDFENKFDKHIISVEDMRQTAIKAKLKRTDYLEYVVNEIARKMAQLYSVSIQCMTKRIRYDEMYIEKIL